MNDGRFPTCKRRFGRLRELPSVRWQARYKGSPTNSAHLRPHVRRWRKERLDAGVSAVTVAKAYRLLKAVFNTAADDGLIRRNPCRIKGASVERSQERPVLTARQVLDLASVIEPRYRALLLLAIFGSLRRGRAGGASPRRRRPKHVERMGDVDDDQLIFTSPEGGPLRQAPRVYP